MAYIRIIPKGMLLIGHEKGYDIYETKDGKQLWGYIGRKKEHFKNPKYWKKLKKVI